MAVLADIPERDTQDGATQLILLRSYLKDRDSSNYRYNDQLLIDLLVLKDKLSVWQELVGASDTDLAWSYNLSEISTPVNRIRVMTNDLLETEILYTDYELLQLLEVIPLRYVVFIINTKKVGGNTFPTDINNPIHILRKYLKDESGEKYTDTQLVDLMIENKLNPFGVLINLADMSLGEKATSSLLETGASLASIDGITFTEASTELKDLKENRDSLSTKELSSVYCGKPVYGVWIDGEDVTETEWEKRWYAL